jgi:hypothetical protein
MSRILGPAIVLTVAVAWGCNGRNAGTAELAEAGAASSAATLDSAPAPSADASASAAAPPPMHHHGLAGSFFRAALEADLTDDEKSAIDKLEEPLGNDPGVHRELAAFHSDLVLFTKAGRMDTAKLQADEAAINKAYAAQQDAQAVALNGLHDALSSEQRKAVVEALRAMQAAHERPPPKPGDTGVTDATARRLERMKSQLVLDADQQRQVAGVLTHDLPAPAAIQAHFDAVKKQMEALFGAFEKDTFDAKKLDVSPLPGKRPSDPMERQARYIGQLLPILRSEQRDRLATMMDHPRMDHGHGGGDSIAEPLDVSEGRGR